jgi:hypothetical protein
MVAVTGAEIRSMQRAAIELFLAAQDFTGSVLDYGCGTQPYRAIVEANGGDYHGYNRGIYPGGSKQDIGPDHPLDTNWDVILSTQMLQYVPDVWGLLERFRDAASRLVLTVATNWPEVEPEDLYRFTQTGITAVLEDVGWEIREHRQLGSVPFGDREQMALGYGIVAA